jgi:hypothetical protein
MCNPELLCSSVRHPSTGNQLPSQVALRQEEDAHKQDNGRERLIHSQHRDPPMFRWHARGGHPRNVTAHPGGSSTDERRHQLPEDERQQYRHHQSDPAQDCQQLSEGPIALHEQHRHRKLLASSTVSTRLRCPDLALQWRSGGVLLFVKAGTADIDLCRGCQGCGEGVLAGARSRSCGNCSGKISER